MLSINDQKGEAKVKLGRITSTFPIDGLQRLQPKKQKKPTTPVRPSGATLYNEQVSPSINLIGKTSLEATHELQEYLDRAQRAGLHEVQVIHGYGEGILRKAVAEYLKKRPDVESFRPGDYYEGGKGVTVVYLK